MLRKVILSSTGANSDLRNGSEGTSRFELLSPETAKERFITNCGDQFERLAFTLQIAGQALLHDRAEALVLPAERFVKSFL